MLLGEVFTNVIQPIWNVSGEFTAIATLYVSIIIILGTAVAFLVYLSSLKYIPSALASTLTAFEPMLATVFSIFIFKTTFTAIEVIGFIFVLLAISLLQKIL